MSPFIKVFVVYIFFMLIGCLLFLLFSLVTVRKLRKNPETKKNLGVELVSGWHIVNVAKILALPLPLIKKMEKSSIAFIMADANLIRKNTNKFDRILGGAFYWVFVASGLFGALLVLLDYMFNLSG